MIMTNKIITTKKQWLKLVCKRVHETFLKDKPYLVPYQYRITFKYWSKSDHKVSDGKYFRTYKNTNANVLKGECKTVCNIELNSNVIYTSKQMVVQMCSAMSRGQLSAKDQSLLNHVDLIGGYTQPIQGETSKRFVKDVIEELGECPDELGKGKCWVTYGIINKFSYNGNGRKDNVTIN